jgi:hypothetical protein
MRPNLRCTVVLRPKVQVMGDRRSWTEQFWPRWRWLCNFWAKIGEKMSKFSVRYSPDYRIWEFSCDCRRMNTMFSEHLRWRVTTREPLVVILQYLIFFNSKNGAGNSLVLSRDPMDCIWKTASQSCSHSEGPKLLIMPTFLHGLNSPLLHGT